MFIEDDFIQISALQHYIFCPRQCALIHVEDAWSENLFTVRGEILHEKADTDTYETRGTLKTVRGLRIHSFRLGITGRADVVELRDPLKGDSVMPVEYKAGEPKDDVSDKVQLCAQALCLEEMMKTHIGQAEFFYGKIRRRAKVDLDEQLRRQTEETIARVHELTAKRKTPKAVYSQKCRNCSLEKICLPRSMNDKSLHHYMERLYQP